MAGLGILGVLACYVGAFLVMPISFAAYAVAYRRVFPETVRLVAPRRHRRPEAGPPNDAPAGTGNSRTPGRH